jgi:hypothetical protein
VLASSVAERLVLHARRHPSSLLFATRTT